VPYKELISSSWYPGRCHNGFWTISFYLYISLSVWPKAGKYLIKCIAVLLDFHVSFRMNN